MEIVIARARGRQGPRQDVRRRARGGGEGERRVGEKGVEGRGICPVGIIHQCRRLRRLMCGRGRPPSCEPQLGNWSLGRRRGCVSQGSGRKHSRSGLRCTRLFSSRPGLGSICRSSFFSVCGSLSSCVHLSVYTQFLCIHFLYLSFYQLS